MSILWNNLILRTFDHYIIPMYSVKNKLRSIKKIMVIVYKTKLFGRAGLDYRQIKQMVGALWLC